MKTTTMQKNLFFQSRVQNRYSHCLAVHLNGKVQVYI